MKKGLKIFTAVAFFFIGAAIFTSKTQANFTGKVSETHSETGFSAQKNVPAKTLYLNNCARCHGINGNGDTELGRLYDTPNLLGRGKKISRKKALRVIQNGDGSMPSFKKKLSAGDMSALANYIRTL